MILPKETVIRNNPLPWTIECKNGMATILDANGNVFSPITDLELGWTDASTGNYVDPCEQYLIIDVMVDAVNKLYMNKK